MWKDHTINYAVRAINIYMHCSVSSMSVKVNRVTDATMQVAGCGDPVVLIHGFGANCTQWRKTIAAVSQEHKVWMSSLPCTCNSSLMHTISRLSHVQVYAIDLLGFGGSEKAPIDYSIELWAEQVRDFCQEFAQTPVTLVGNSIGSLVSLEAARMMESDPNDSGVKGLALINCAGEFSRQYHRFVHGEESLDSSVGSSIKFHGFCESL